MVFYKFGLSFLTLVVLTSAQNFYSPGSDVRCARMWDELNYGGQAVDCTDNERKMNLGPFDCKAQSLYVRNGCTLTVFDKTGCQRQMDRSASCLYAVCKSNIVGKIITLINTWAWLYIFTYFDNFSGTTKSLLLVVSVMGK